MKKEPPDKFICLQRHGLLTVPVGITSPEKRNMAVPDSEDAVIADGDSMGISAEVLKDSLGAIEGRFAIDDPLLMVEMPHEGFEVSGIFEMTETAGKDKITSLEVIFEEVKELPSEQCRQDPYGNEEAFAA